MRKRRRDLKIEKLPTCLNGKRSCAPGKKEAFFYRDQLIRARYKFGKKRNNLPRLRKWGKGPKKRNVKKNGKGT